MAGVTTITGKTGTAREQAAYWFVRMRSSHCTPDLAREFNRWLREDIANQCAFRDIDDTWLASKDLKNCTRVIEAGTIYNELKAEASRARSTARSRTKSAWWWAAAATVVLAVSVGWWVNFSGPTQPERYATVLGELKTVRLSDNSIITLNTRSVVEVDYSKAYRQLTLIRGQVNFEVAKDPSRPFVVNAGTGWVTALGTTFEVYKKPGETLVTLLDGEVEVVNVSSETQHMARLTPGQQVQFSDTGNLSAVVNVDTERAQSWQQGKLNFKEAPLASVLEEANRYSELKLELGSESLADLPVTGIFNAGKSEDLAFALEEFLNVTLNKVSYQKIVIEPDYQK